MRLYWVGKHVPFALVKLEPARTDTSGEWLRLINSTFNVHKVRRVSRSRSQRAQGGFKGVPFVGYRPQRVAMRVQGGSVGVFAPNHSNTGLVAPECVGLRTAHRFDGPRLM